MQNSVISTWITRLYGFQPSSVVFTCKIATFGPEWQIYIWAHTFYVVLWMQYSEICTRITSLYGSHPLSVVFVCKTATFGAELQVSMGPRPHLSFCAFKTAWLTSELLVSMGPSPHVCLLDAKERLLDRNNKSLWVPALMYAFWMQKSDFWTGLTSLYGSQTKPVVLCMQNSVISSWITSLYGFQPSSVVFAYKTATLGPDLQVCMSPSLNVWYWALITAC